MEKETKLKQRPPRLGTTQIHLLERLCNASGVSGDEGEVRSVVLEQIRTCGDVKIDALGNVLLSRRGSPEIRPRPRVMLAAHMDEVGLMLTNDEGDGIFRFDVVGRLDVRQLAGKAVRIGCEHLPGVIGANPIHLITSEEIKNPFSLEMLRIDVGPGNGSKVKIGDRAIFSTPFSRVGPSLRAKALDDRLGVATLIEIIKHAPPNIDLLAAFTVQEEVGLRGAKVAAYALEPQMAIVLDCTPAYDLPNREDGNPLGSENTRYNTHLGAGPAIYLADRSTLSDPRLIRHLVETAEAAGIPYQLRQPGGGSTDAGVIHKQREGIPSVSVSVPGRYLHTAVSIARLSDWKHSLTLIHSALARLTLDILTPDRR